MCVCASDVCGLCVRESDVMCVCERVMCVCACVKSPLFTF